MHGIDSNALPQQILMQQLKLDRLQLFLNDWKYFQENLMGNIFKKI